MQGDTRKTVVRSFLSHASEDKAIVESVAEHLGRQFCLFDKYEFSSGIEFKESIEKALDATGLFVLFASSSSIEKYWVKQEMSEALLRKMQGSLERILVYRVDQSLQIERIPEAFRRAKIETLDSPAQIARDIEMHVEEIIRSRGGVYYIGRGADHDEFSSLILKKKNNRPPNAFLVVGLPGVGRREFVRRSVRDNLSLRKSVQIRIGQGHTINDLALQLSEHTSAPVGKDVYYENARKIQKLPEEEAIRYVLDEIANLVSASELVLLVDEGGLVTPDGALQGWFKVLVAESAGRSGGYFSSISHRKPIDADDTDLAFYRLKPISEESTRLLISTCADGIELNIEKEHVDELAKYIAGYPPAAYYAVQQAKEYGISAVIMSKERVVEFRRRLFFEHIAKLNLGDSDNKKNILKILSSFSPLPLSAIGACLSLDAETLVGEMLALIDLSLVHVEGGLYMIADPVSEASTKHFGLPTAEDSKKIASQLAKYLAEQKSENRRLDVSRALFRAARISGDRAYEQGVVRLTSDLVGLVEDLYHQRRYDDAVRTGLLAADEAPRASQSIGYLVRSFVQLERWREAEEWLPKYSKLVPRRDALFLEAFMRKRQGRTRDAIDLYEQSSHLGKTGASISRELSQCYLLIGDFKKAREMLQIALDRDPDNRFVIDLWATIAANLGEREEANEALDRLEVVDDSVFFLFRKSRVLWNFGDGDGALDVIREAVRTEGRPPFQVLAQLAICEMVRGSVLEAERIIDKLDRDFSSTKKDIRAGLRARLLLTQGSNEEAMEILERTIDKSTPSYQSLLLDVLQGIEADESISNDRKLMYSRLKSSVGSLSAGVGSLVEIDIR